MADRAGLLLSTAQFIESAARHISNEARKVTDLDAEEVSCAIRGLYSRAKTLKDQRAKLMAPAVADNPTKGPTNVGNPTAKGKGVSK